MFVSIVTTSYNRAYRLPILYESICKQVDTDFEWVIVDDGSTDDTESLVNSYIEENKVLIRYFKKENGGMNTAMNVGVNNSEGLFVFKVDSDDIILPNAIERIRYYYDSGFWKENQDNKLCGLCFLNQDIKGEIIGNRFTKDLFISDYIEERVNNNIKGDKSEVIFTEVRKRFPYMEFPNEKRYPTSGVLASISKEYNMVFINESIYIRDYQTDGITKSGTNKGVFATPHGMIHHSNIFMTKDFKFNIRLQNSVFYILSCIYTKEKMFHTISNSTAPFLVSLMYLPSLALYIYLQLKEKSLLRLSQVFFKNLFVY